MLYHEESICLPYLCYRTFQSKSFRWLHSSSLWQGKVLTRSDTVTVNQLGDQLLMIDWALKGRVTLSSHLHARNPTSWNEPVKLQAKYIAIYINIIICTWRQKSSRIQVFLIHVTRTSRRGLGKKSQILPLCSVVTCLWHPFQ